jgi:hypothetical protein
MAWNLNINVPGKWMFQMISGFQYPRRAGHMVDLPFAVTASIFHIPDQEIRF